MRPGTCPKIFETFGASELWNQRISSGLVTPDIKRDVPLPANVRRYFFPGTTHGGGEGGFKPIGSDTKLCTLSSNPNPEDDQMRALLIALTQWIESGTAPPASRYPTVAAGTLVRDADGALKPQPWTPGPRAANIANPLLVYDFGPRFRYDEESGVIDKMPPAILKVVPAMVPQIDGDGNDLGGVQSVLARAPLGSYLGWNTYRAGPFAGRVCSFLGGFIPFAKTKSDRIAAGESPVVRFEERYHTRAGYLAAVRKAVTDALAERLLLPEDGATLFAAATRETKNGALSFLKP